MGKDKLMPVKLNQIEGLMLDKVHSVPGKGCLCLAHGECECGCKADWTDYTTWNKAIDQIGRREIGNNRERLAKIIYEKVHNEWGIGPKWDSAELEKREYYFLIADAIIKEESSILEFKSKKGE